MVEDARFADGGERPLRLKAEEVGDLEVLSTLVQDAVFPIPEMKWEAGKRRLSLLLNRFRWEDKSSAQKRNRGFERVQSVLSVDDVLKVQSQGVDRSDVDLILSVMSLEFEPGEDGAGRMTVILAGDGAIRMDVEAINVMLEDVTRPYLAPSRQAPAHDL